MNPIRTTRAATLVGALLASLQVTACSRGGSDQAFRWSGSVPPGATVHLRDGVGNIDVRHTGGQTVVVDGSRQWRRSRSRDIRFVVSHVGNDYYVCAMWRSSGRCGSSGYRGRQTGGFLTMFSLFHHGSDATADFTMDLPAGVALDATTVNGSVHVDGATSGVTAKTINGSVEATNVRGPVALHTVTGDVSLSIDSLADSDSVRLETVNGSIHAELPTNLQGAFDLSVVNGFVHSDIAVPAQASRSGIIRRLRGQVGSSSRAVRMRTVNGTISVVGRGTAAAAH